MINLACWNIRGLNATPKQLEVKKMILDHNLTLVCLIKTRVSMIHKPFVVNLVYTVWEMLDNYNSHDLGRIGLVGILGSSKSVKFLKLIRLYIAKQIFWMVMIGSIPHLFMVLMLIVLEELFGIVYALISKILLGWFLVILMSLGG